MASSKYSDYVAVPEQVLALEAEGLAFCRPRLDHYDNPFDNFLSKVAETTNDRSSRITTGETVKAVMLFHNYPGTIGTVVIEIYHVYLDFGGHRIDFRYSPWMKEFHGCPNFWAGFGMAIAPVCDDCPEFGGEDSDGSEFIELVKNFGIVAEKASEIPKKKIGECPTCKGAEHSHDGNPFTPPTGSVQDTLFVCPECGQRWWQYNNYYHLWKAVDEEEFFAAKRNEEIAPYLDMQ